MSADDFSVHPLAESKKVMRASEEGAQATKRPQGLQQAERKGDVMEWRWKRIGRKRTAERMTTSVGEKTVHKTTSLLSTCFSASTAAEHMIKAELGKIQILRGSLQMLI